MVENEFLPQEEYLDMVKQVVKIAHAKGGTGEAQVGHPKMRRAERPRRRLTLERRKPLSRRRISDALGVAVGMSILYLG